MASTNIAYWLERERQERRAYAQSSDPAVQEVHRQLADRYADAAWGAQENEPNSVSVTNPIPCAVGTNRSNAGAGETMHTQNAAVEMRPAL